MSEELEMGPLQKWLQPLLEDIVSAVRDICHTNSCDCHEEEPPIVVAEETVFVTVTAEKVALRRIKKYNEAGYPRMAIYGKTTAGRYRYQEGDKVMTGDKVRADGGVRYFEVLQGQTDGFGKDIPDYPQLFLPVTAID